MKSTWSTTLDLGRRLRERIAAMEGGTVSLGDLARVLRTSEETVLARWRDRRLLGWRETTEVRFSAWQFGSAGMLPGVEPVLEVLRGHDHWRVLLYFLTTYPELGRQRPLDLIRADQAEAVIAHARGLMAEDDFWRLQA